MLTMHVKENVISTYVCQEHIKRIYTRIALVPAYLDDEKKA